MMRQQIYGSSSLTSLKCDKPDFTFNYGQNKKVRVVLAGDIVPAKNYYLAHVQIVPEFVSVYANRHELEAIKTVLTENLNLSNISDTVVRVVNLRAIAGAKTVPAKVKVTLFPDVLTEGSADVPIVAVNKPRNLIIRTFPQTVKVRYTVGSMVYRLPGWSFYPTLPTSASCTSFATRASCARQLSRRRRWIISSSNNKPNA